MSMIIYVLTNIHNNKQYVGKSKETATRRFRQHVRDAKNGSDTAIHRAIRKYGAESFIVETVDSASTKDELKQKEVDWIAKLHTLGEGYNMTPGGDGYGHKHSPETIEKLRQRRKEYFQEHPEMKQQAAEWAKQASLSEEGRKRKRDRMKGNSHSVGMTYQHTEEAKAAIGRAHQGKVVSEETRQKLREARNREVAAIRSSNGQFTSGVRSRKT